ncbi:discoidin domain-containing protein [Nocardioides sp. B-3]|uniref:discoidin domain-containing protein n=1 Tax=Nocardioides sp. B-3 TaxID=2895565 RepID=UPI0021539475|nr:hypothetical protein [Nocardioides sp. B-3]UUZ58850.1 hypothetical protein LP418_22695 [Nocardioides sp. B-3]
MGSEPTILATDADPEISTVGPLLLTDGLRLVERNFGALHDSTSHTLGGEEPWTLPGVVHDYDLVDHDRWVTRSRLINARAVSATTSRSNPSSLGGSEPGAMPYAAIDGDPNTAWISAPYPDAPQSRWVDFGASRGTREIAVTPGPGTGAEQLRLSTPSWESPVLEFVPGETRKIAGPASASRLRIDDVSGKPNNDVSIAEVTVVGPPVGRELVLPQLPTARGSPDAILLRRVSDGRDGCAEVGTAVRCRPGAVVAPEEPSDFRRRFSVPSDIERDVAMTVRPRGGPELAGMMQKDQPVSIAASVTALADPRASATAMIDGDSGTTWLAPAGEVRPVIDVNLLRRQRIRGLAVAVEFGTAARVPQTFELSRPGGSRFVEVDDDGTASFPPIVASRLRLEVRDAEPATDFSFRGAASEVPIGIGELRLEGVPYLPLSLSNDAVDLGCGSGPDLTVNGEILRTKVTVSPCRPPGREVGASNAVRSRSSLPGGGREHRGCGGIGWIRARHRAPRGRSSPRMRHPPPVSLEPPRNPSSHLRAPTRPPGTTSISAGPRRWTAGHSPLRSLTVGVRGGSWKAMPRFPCGSPLIASIAGARWSACWL